jgi:hypothetical protein
MLSVFSFLLIFFAASTVEAQVSACYRYDILSTPASEVKVDFFVKCMIKGDTLYLDGGVDELLIDELRIYAATPIKHISLNSGGGRVDDAFEIAHFIRENNITTHVREGGVCKSACTLLYQAGAKRTAHPSAIFMYHSARYIMQSSFQQKELNLCLKSPSEKCLRVIDEKTSRLREDTDKLFSFYQDYGISDDFYNLYKSLPDDEQWYKSGNYLRTVDWELTAEESMEYNIVENLKL